MPTGMSANVAGVFSSQPVFDTYVEQYKNGAVALNVGTVVKFNVTVPFSIAGDGGTYTIPTVIACVTGDGNLADAIGVVIGDGSILTPINAALLTGPALTTVAANAICQVQTQGIAPVFVDSHTTIHDRLVLSANTAGILTSAPAGTITPIPGSVYGEALTTQTTYSTTTVGLIWARLYRA